MLPKANRVTKKKDFTIASKKGKGIKMGFLAIKFWENGLNVSRFGFIVSKRISKKAVERNRVKRRLKELARGKLNQVKRGIDVVIIACPGIEEKNFREIKTISDKLLEKAGILNSS